MLLLVQVSSAGPKNSTVPRLGTSEQTADFHRFSTIPTPATPFLLPGVIPDLPRRCWNEEEGRRDHDQRSAAISLKTSRPIMVDLRSGSLRSFSSFQHCRGRSEITLGRRNGFAGAASAGMVEKLRKSGQKTRPDVRS
ncbi:hypothetical protein ACLB2K_041015 [Fragaria x ananassa]